MEMDQLREKYRALSEAIAIVLREHGVQHYVIGYLTPEGQAVMGLNGNPVVMTMLLLQLGTDIQSAMREMMGIEKGPEEILYQRMPDEIKNKLN